MIIREEQESDYRAVEELTREAFWNLYLPGADEHLIVHNLRKRPEFIKKLCLVAEIEKKIVGNIVFSASFVKDELGKNHEVVTFGPLSVLPSMQGKGIGGALVKESIKIAKIMGIRAIMILGYPSYYERFGFENSHKFGICMLDNSYPKALQVLELHKGALDEIRGQYVETDAFHTDEKELEEFNKTFPPKEKFVTASQKAFAFMVSLKYDDIVPANVYKVANSTTRISESDAAIEPHAFFSTLGDTSGSQIASADDKSNNATAAVLSVASKQTPANNKSFVAASNLAATTLFTKPAAPNTEQLPTSAPVDATAAKAPTYTK